MGLIIALDEKNLARGSLFMDDGESTGMFNVLRMLIDYLNHHVRHYMSRLLLRCKTVLVLIWCRLLVA